MKILSPGANGAVGHLALDDLLKSESRCTRCGPKHILDAQEGNPPFRWTT
jgi:hypothetical protein